jgi:hypothetical protein
MIPKKIIYIWFGKGKKGKLIEKCLSVNKKVFSDWEFKEYNEDNYDIESYKYIKEAYEAKKYAFASDCARFDILYRNGGVYIDTDVEFLKELPDSFLNNLGFAGVESNNEIAPGLIFACEPGNAIVKEILDSYKQDSFILKDGKYNMKTVVDRVTEIFIKHGFKVDGTKQIVDGFHIYPSDYFCAFDFITREFSITDNTYSIHHYAGTWLPFYRKPIRMAKKIIYRLIGKENFKRLALIKRKLFGNIED